MILVNESVEEREGCPPSISSGKAGQTQTLPFKASGCLGILQVETPRLSCWKVSFFSTCPAVLRACLESTVAFEKRWMLPEVPFNHALTLFYLQNVTPVGQDLLQIRSYVYAEEPNIDIHNFVGTFTRVSKP